MDFARDAVVFARDALTERRAHSHCPRVPVLKVASQDTRGIHAMPYDSEVLGAALRLPLCATAVATATAALNLLGHGMIRGEGFSRNS